MKRATWGLGLGSVLVLLTACSGGGGGGGGDEVGPTTSDTERPQLASAISKSNTSIVLTFSEAMDESIGDPSNYSIVQENVNSEVGSLPVDNRAGKTPLVSDDKKTVTLFTASQSEVTYRVTVAGVKDVAGNVIDQTRSGAGSVIDPASATFAGTGPVAGEFVDSDGDTLSDDEELKGWVVELRNAGRTVRFDQVSSSPFFADTDGDGVDDAEELKRLSNPRDRDTDNDGIPDALEINGVFTEATDKDSDGDGLIDGDEVNVSNSNPEEEDSDGDQVADGDEDKADSRDARIAELPQIDLYVSSVDLSFNTEWTNSKTSEVVKAAAKTVTKTLKEARELSQSRTSTVADQVQADVTFKYENESGSEGGKISNSLELHAGYQHNWSSSWTEDSKTNAEKEYADSLNTSAQDTASAQLTRTVKGGTLKAGVTMKNSGQITFTIQDIVITVFAPDLNRKPGKYESAYYRPIGELTRENVATVTLAPGAVANFVFIEKDDVGADDVERLMKDPSGMRFEISYYKLTDGIGREFPYVQQEVFEKTAVVEIDYGVGDKSVESYNIATGIGTPIGKIVDLLAERSGKTPAEVYAYYGLNVNNSKDQSVRIFRDLDGGRVGVNFHDVMENVVGLTRYNEADRPSGSLTDLQKQNSYSTTTENGIEKVYRIRTRANGDGSAGNNRRWAVVTPTGIIRSGALSLSEPGQPVARDEQIRAGVGQGVVLAYLEDNDLDRLPARMELNYGCSDGSTDTDGDGLSDFFEIIGVERDANGIPVDFSKVWEISVAGSSPYFAYSSCSDDDSDNDGLKDDEEYNLPTAKVIDATYSFGSAGSIYWWLFDVSTDGTPGKTGKNLKTLGRLDPQNLDTDGDGISDKVELDGYSVKLLVAPGSAAPIGTKCVDDPANADPLFVICRTDPLNPDSDGDYASDGNERWRGTDPTFKDANTLANDDKDALLNYEEGLGWEVKVWAKPGAIPKVCTPANTTDCPEGKGPTSLINDEDSDNDGLWDDQERDLGTHPQVADTDGDGRTDFEEVYGAKKEVYFLSDGSKNTSATLIPSDPRYFDTDGDGLGDGAEVTGWNVVAKGKTIPSDPRKPDSDGDELDDSLEKYQGSDPTDTDTDKDAYKVDDRNEYLLGTRPNDPNDRCANIAFDSIYAQQTIGGSDYVNNLVNANVVTAGYVDRFGGDDISNEVTVEIAYGQSFKYPSTVQFTSVVNKTDQVRLGRFTKIQDYCCIGWTIGENKADFYNFDSSFKDPDNPSGPALESITWDSLYDAGVTEIRTRANVSIWTSATVNANRDKAAGRVKSCRTNFCSEQQIVYETYLNSPFSYIRALAPLFTPVFKETIDAVGNCIAEFPTSPFPVPPAQVAEPGPAKAPLN